YCREQHGESEQLQWGVQQFEALHQIEQQFDAITCIGNSLSLLPDVDAVRIAIGHMARLLRRGGVIVIHVLNCWKLADGPIYWQKLQRVNIDGTERAVLKGVHRAGNRAFVDVVMHDCDATEPTLEARSTPILALEDGPLLNQLRSDGCCEVRVFGDHARTPFDRATSIDLIVVARSAPGAGAEVRPLAEMLRGLYRLGDISCGGHGRSLD
ncbi:MAG: class I SAM-dependent methyltransferase, partial [Phycisphaerae bacterium]|nr:class I SAM-dependent methyltransferase [Phycisphaerae bacterium]